MREIPINMEDASTMLSCAIANLNLIQDAFYRETFAMEEEQKFLGADCLMSYCDAMCAACWELDQIRDEMDAAIEAEYANRAQLRASVKQPQQKIAASPGQNRGGGMAQT